MKNIVRSLTLVLASALTFATVCAPTAYAATDDYVPGICSAGDKYSSTEDDCTTYNLMTTDSFNYKMFKVVDADSPLRLQPNKYSEVVAYLQIGDILRNGTQDGNWICFHSEETDYYIYAPHVEEHRHTWKKQCYGDLGHVEACNECNTTRIVDDYNPYIQCNGNIVCEVFAGDWSNTSSTQSILINSGLKLGAKYIPVVGPFLNAALYARDISAGFVHTGTEMAYGNFDKSVISLVSTVVSLTGGSDCGGKLVCEYLDDIYYTGVTTMIDNYDDDLLDIFFDLPDASTGYTANYCSEWYPN